MEFNAFLRGKGAERFAQVVGDTTRLTEVRYVITLDTDTQLPRDAARQMVGTMAHLLNRPVFDPKRRRVVAGYGILQLRVGVSLPSSRQSWFVRLFAGEPGVDPYTRVVSDVYQDLFGEGSFIGKGIYDVDAFEKTCHCFPENTVLSHDLLESAYARSALLSDVELYEEYPARYPTEVSRRHRWMRGGLADYLVVAAVGSGNLRARQPQPGLRAFLVEDSRQPPAQLGPGCSVGALLGSWLLGGPRWGGVSLCSSWWYWGRSRCWGGWWIWCVNPPIYRCQRICA